ncbi:MAG: PhzF family phenazine biosynthesis protein, partial [Vulcanococcus sp.]
MQARPAVLVEAFTEDPLQGNGAAVVWLDQPAQASWMQRLAGSFKQSETAFLHRDGEGPWRLRWFTPTCEVP